MNALQPVTELNATLFPYFGPVPLLPGEDPAGYDGLLARVSTAVKPQDIIEEIWIQEVVALTWDAFRLRRARAAWLAAKRGLGIVRALEPLSGRDERDALQAGYARRDTTVIAEMDARLASAGATSDVVTAHTLMSQWELMERIDRMIMTTEMRRDAVLREIERHRTSFAAALRARLRERAQDADYQVIDANIPSAAGAGAPS
jgi:hypothetical protein